MRTECGRDALDRHAQASKLLARRDHVIIRDAPAAATTFDARSPHDALLKLARDRFGDPHLLAKKPGEARAHRHTPSTTSTSAHATPTGHGALEHETGVPASSIQLQAPSPHATGASGAASGGWPVEPVGSPA